MRGFWAIVAILTISLLFAVVLAVSVIGANVYMGTTVAAAIGIGMFAIYAALLLNVME